MLTSPRFAGKTIAERMRSCALHSKRRDFLFLYELSGGIRSFTYAEVLARAASWAWHFLDMGLAPRSRVVIILQHSLDLYTAFAGAILADLVPSQFAHPSVKQPVDDYFRTLGVLLTSNSPAAVVTYQGL